MNRILPLRAPFALLPALVLAALSATAAAQDGSPATTPAMAPLRAAQSFDAIADPQERSRALFVEAGRGIHTPLASMPSVMRTLLGVCPTRGLLIVKRA